MRNYFEKVNCIEALKKQYFALAKAYHSDITGGSDEVMKIIDGEYDRLFKVYKDVHQIIKKDAKPSDTYRTTEPSSETLEDFRTTII